MSEKIINQRGASGIYAKDANQPIVWWQPSAMTDPKKTLKDYNGRHVDGGLGTSVAAMAAFLQGRIRTAGNGILVAQQSFIFSDDRTGVAANADGSGAMTVTNSGFEITQEAFRTRKGNYYIFVTREAKEENGAQPGNNASGDLMPAQIE